MAAFQRHLSSAVLLMLLTVILALPIAVTAQNDGGSSAVFLGGAIWLICGATFFIINVAILIWVYRDAKKRGADAILWAVLTFVFGLIGLLLYFAIGRKNTGA